MAHRFVTATLAVFLCLIGAVNASALTQPRVQGFIPNEGQWPEEVLYLSRSHGLHLWITKTGMVFDQYRIVGSQREGHVLRLTWNDAARLSAPTQVDPTAMRVHMFGASQQSHTEIPVVKGMRFAELWNGIDLLYYLDGQGNVRYDFDVRPGAAMQNVGFNVDGDVGMTIEPQDVTLKTSIGSVSMGDLFAYVLGRRSMQTQAMFSASSNGVQFRVPQWSGDVPLRVDPVVVGTFIGGEGDGAVVAVRTVSNGVVLAGWTTGIEFPKNVGAYRTDIAAGRDVFIAKMSSDLSTVKAYTYYGGSNDELLTAMTVNADGAVFITGETQSNNLPISVGAVGQLYTAEIDAFIAGFDANLATLTFSTYIGGNKNERPKAIATHSDGSIFVAGGTTSNANFPVRVPHQATLGGQEDGFLLRLSATGGTLFFCTYFGKSGVESFKGLAVDNSGSPYVTGSTTSSDFETAPTPGRWGTWTRLPYDRSYNDGPTDAFLIKFFPDGTLSKADDGTFSTFFGGKGADEGRGVFIDIQGRPTIVGVTSSTNLPATGGLVQSAIGGQDIFMATFSEDGRGLAGCTYFGGSADDNVTGFVPDPYRNSTLMYGTTASQNFPSAGIGVETTRKGGTDGFLASIGTASNQYITLVGGAGPDAVIAASPDAKGDFYFVLDSESPDLFTHRTSWMSERPIGGSAYVGKWAEGDIALSTPVGGETWCKGSTRGISWSAVAMHSDDVYVIEFSTDNGTTWTEIAKDVTSTSYQWQVPTTLSSTAEYIVRVRSNRGHAAESKALTLAEPPTITAQPTDVHGCAGSPIELRVQAEGAQLRYQWRKNGTNINGETKATLMIPALSAATAGTYDVVVNGACSPNVTSTSVKVLLDPATEISKQPASVSVEEGKEILLSVTAVGAELTYQWTKNGENVPSATGATLRIAAATTGDAGDYACVVAGSCGTVTSTAATVQVQPATSVDEEETLPFAVRVLGPVPSSTSVMVQISAPASAMATIRIVDANGGVAATLDAMMLQPGVQQIEVDVARLASGAYGLEVSVAGGTQRAMILVQR